MSWTMFSLDGQRKYLTQSETRRFLQEARRDESAVHCFCWLIAVTGCRISEALALTPANIDFEERIIVFECLKKRRRHVYRSIPAPTELLHALRLLVRTDRIRPTDRIWPWSRMTGYRRIREVMERACLAGTHASPKGLRHGFGVSAIQSGVPLNMVQRWLGHADMKTTAIYTSAMGPEERDIAARMWGRAFDTNEGAKGQGGQARTQTAAKAAPLGEKVKLKERVAVNFLPPERLKKAARLSPVSSASG